MPLGSSPTTTTFAMCVWGVAPTEYHEWAEREVAKPVEVGDIPPRAVSVSVAASSLDSGYDVLMSTELCAFRAVDVKMMAARSGVLVLIMNLLGQVNGKRGGGAASLGSYTLHDCPVFFGFRLCMFGVPYVELLVYRTGLALAG